MENEQIVLILILITCIGMLTILTGIVIKIITQRKNTSCSKKVTGHVVGYRFLGKGNMYPVVDFVIEGRTYSTKKKFNSIITTRVTGIPIWMQSNAYEDDKGNLHVKTGPVANLKNIAEKLWPMGKEMTVYYNPKNPKVNYVERPITNKFLSTFINIIGTSIIFLAVALYFIILNGK